MDIGMKGPPGFEQMRPLAGADNDETFFMLGDPCVCRQPLGPAQVGENGEPSSQSVSAPLDLRALYIRTEPVWIACTFIAAKPVKGSPSTA
jgi:hypothetical protein